ncbi:two-component response regulator [Kalymmatonema gypsitolerans NIES-4073]|nr:two-component response regulator [Scytonema sp. NIES-4073]
MKKIFVIEDEAQTRKLFLKWLKAEGFYAKGAQNGLIGVQRADEELPDLIISEIMMPKLDGYSVLTTVPRCAKTQPQRLSPLFLTRPITGRHGILYALSVAGF